MITHPPLKKMKKTSIEIVTDDPIPISTFSWSDFPVLQEFAYNEQPSPFGTADKTICKRIRNHALEEGLSSSLLDSASLPTLVSSEESEFEDVAMLDSYHPSNNRLSTVNFSTVQIREYKNMLGDHPWADSYPLAIDWNYRELETQSVDEFEQSRVPQPNTFQKPQRLTEKQRRQRLVQATGLSVEELDQEERNRAKEVVMDLARARLNIPLDDRRFIGNLMHSKSCYDLRGDLSSLSISE